MVKKSKSENVVTVRKNVLLPGYIWEWLIESAGEYGMPEKYSTVVKRILELERLHGHYRSFLQLKKLDPKKKRN